MSVVLVFNVRKIVITGNGCSLIESLTVHLTDCRRVCCLAMCFFGSGFFLITH